MDITQVFFKKFARFAVKGLFMCTFWVFESDLAQENRVFWPKSGIKKHYYTFGSISTLLADLLFISGISTCELPDFESVKQRRFL
jgi:hypothetical protein